MLPFLSKRFQAPPQQEAKREPDLSFIKKGEAVGDSADLRRVLALPRRSKPSDETLAKWAQQLESEFGLGSKPCECGSRFKRPCCKHLLPVQAWALMEAREVGGLLGPIKVGGGKSLLDLLTPTVVGAKVAVLLLPPNLKHQMLEVDWHYYGQHWRLPNLAGSKFYFPDRPTLHVVAFSELSGAKSTDLLKRLRPDVIIADEAHNLKNKKASRTKRFLRHFKEVEGTRFFCWSGTLTSKSIRDYAHLSEFSLKQGSPLPHHYMVVEQWAAHLDPSDWRAPCGRLALLGSEPDARDGFAKRLLETKGVVTSLDTEGCNASLIVQKLPFKASSEVEEKLKTLEKTWNRPDGERLITALDVARCAKEISCGFFYRWRFPRGEPRALIDEWLEVRKNWHKELREKLKTGREFMDSPLLCAKAAIRWRDGYGFFGRDGERIEVPPLSKQGPLPVWDSEYFPKWEVIRHKVKPETEAVWFDESLPEKTLEWLKKEPGIAWYEFGAVAEKVQQLARESGFNNLTYLGPGDVFNELVSRLQGHEHALASIRAHGTGKNLQQFNRALLTSPPADGAIFEQLLGRLFRRGQLSDTVSFEVFQHTEPFKKAVESARAKAEYSEETLTSRMLMNAATWVL